VLRWRLVGRSRASVVLRARPKLTGRDSHALHQENSLTATEVGGDDGVVRWQPYRDLPAVRAVHSGTYQHAPQWYRRIQFPCEQQRGLEFEEDWWSPGEFRFLLRSGRPADLVFSIEPDPVGKVESLLRAERSRRRTRAAPTSLTDPFTARLWEAAEAFLSLRDGQPTIVAGYPWFTDWGRDTFIALPGLCLVTGRHRIAWQVISAFAGQISDGMIPNRFSDAGEQPEYNTVDASLWFIHAVDRYLAYSHDLAGVRALWPTIKSILDGYRRGTRYGIRMDQDGLIMAGVPGVQLTWMDAKVGDRVVTPRHGKPVEIQALWIRALSIGMALAKKFRDRNYAEQCRLECALALHSFQERFWYSAGGYLFDVIDGPDGDDPSVRPNQLYALSLVDGVLSKDQGRRMLAVVERHLLTPAGLRTLAPSDPRYRGRYEGGVSERDGAYHQGTVWPFLLGPFVTAWLKVHGATQTNKRRARRWLEGIEPHLDQACLGQVSEIFDGDPPHAARGCIAQAWSVAELLRVLLEDLTTVRPART
jgi:predicted glycogen debranching enzyme